MLSDEHKDKWHLEGEHMIWHGALNKDGYARVWDGEGNQSVARLVAEETHGPAPEGHQASHTCDTPACITPEHIIWETVKDNNRRKRGKGKGAYKHGNKWQSVAERDGKRVHLGTFETAEQAREAYLQYV